jgi:hypothetical protein
MFELCETCIMRSLPGNHVVQFLRRRRGERVSRRVESYAWGKGFLGGYACELGGEERGGREWAGRGEVREVRRCLGCLFWEKGTELDGEERVDLRAEFWVRRWS